MIIAPITGIIAARHDYRPPFRIPFGIRLRVVLQIRSETILVEGLQHLMSLGDGTITASIDDVKAGWYYFSVTIVTPEKELASLARMITFLFESSLERARSESFTALRLIIVAPGHIGCKSL